MKNENQPKFSYMVVTADEYELPLSPPFDSVQQLAKFLGISSATIYNHLYASSKGRINGKNSIKRYIKFEEGN